MNNSSLKSNKCIYCPYFRRNRKKDTHDGIGTCRLSGYTVIDNRCWCERSGNCAIYHNFGIDM